MKETSDQFERRVEVAAGLLLDGAGRIFLGRRPKGSPLAGFWEFPGGKQSDGETSEDALGRELGEELGITPESCELLARRSNCYDGRTTWVVSYYVVRSWSGVIDDRHYSESAWVKPADLAEYRHLRGNVEFCEDLVAGVFEQLGRPGR